MLTSTAATGRRVYSHADLQRLLRPKSIAIVGASARPEAFGAITRENLATYTGKIFLVNSRYDKIGDEPCYPSLSALPEVPDCAIVAVNRELTVDIMRECAKLGVGGGILYASGFSETGKPEHIALQNELAKISHESGVRMIGPNMIGAVNFSIGARMTFTPNVPLVKPGVHSIGYCAQSGSFGYASVQGHMHGVSLSHILACGNAIDVDVADYVNFLVDEPECRAIACIFEGMVNPMRLVEAAERAWDAGKPVVVMKLARGEMGAKAALSHSGTLAGSDASWCAMFERCGIVLVEDLETLVETATFLAKGKQPKAKGTAIITYSGAYGVHLTDKAEKHGLPMPQPSPETRAILAKNVPEFGAPNNPCDITAQPMAPDSLMRCVEAMLRDPAYGALVVPHTWVGKEFNRLTTIDLGDLPEAKDKPIAFAWSTQWLEGPGAVEMETHPNLGVFRSTDRLFFTLAQWQRLGARRAAGPRQYVRVAPTGAAASAAALIKKSPNSTLTEREAKAVLAEYGVPVVGEQLVTGAKDAVAAAERLGMPVVMKVESPDIPHKTEAGVIRLGLKSAADVEAAYAAVMANANKVKPVPKINGVLVQPMVPQGTEMLVGARIDDLFGPMVVVGLGGVTAELMKDVAVALAPVTKSEALDMLGKLKGQAALEGFRGLPKVDRDKLADIIVRLSEFAADQREVIAELDVNPLICTEKGIVAVDALIARKVG
jgi:acyl-CoA synthetase (NDP forming)